jgi:hypothetical protein
VKNEIDNKGNLTYKQYDVGFLLANFHHILHEFNEFFFSCTSSTSVFWEGTMVKDTLVEGCAWEGAHKPLGCCGHL